MESTSTPVRNGQGSNDLSEFLEELRVLQQAARILEVPVKDLIEFRMYRNRVEQPRTEGYELTGQASNRLPPTNLPSEPSLENQPMFGLDRSSSMPLQNSTALGPGPNSTANVSPRTLASPSILPNEPNVSYSIMAGNELGASPLFQYCSDFHGPLNLSLHPQSIPTVDQNLLSRDSNPSLNDSAVADRDTLEGLEFNISPTHFAHNAPLLGIQDLVPSYHPAPQSSEDGEPLVTAFDSAEDTPTPAPRRPTIHPDGLHDALDRTSTTQQDQHSIGLEISSSSRPIVKFRQIQPRSSSKASVSRTQASNESLVLPNPIVLDGTPIQKSKRRGPLALSKRLETSDTRKNKACVRCHMQRTRCLSNPDDPFGECLTCVGLKGPTLSKLPCLRYKISDSQLLDKGPHPRFSWTRRWTTMKICEIEDWASDGIKTITLTQDVGNASYNLQVREFTPLPGDSLVRAWNVTGGVRSHPCAPYAIQNMRETCQTFISFVDRYMETYIEHYIDGNDPLLSKTYQMALGHSRSSQVKDERVLLDSVLRLWVGSRMESKQERVSSKEVLGMTPQDWDPAAGNYGKYLVPPVLQAQIEIITTSTILLPMKQQVLKILQKLIEKNLIKSWFTIYLTVFILLHSCSMLTRAEAVRAAREGSKGTQSRFFNHNIVEEFHSGARTMLAYFHYCNKGSHPFSMDWNCAHNVSFAQLDARQVQFLNETVALVKSKRSHFEHIKLNKMFEDDYYFISQLYELHWYPTHTV
ncbi:hypothetical protein GGR51DRAFT_512806 [Nemania sp. FL0031]|nr:hypothetical protein GGR51DRAFT_512806 [Nemania sp. FL0031]